MTSSKRVGEQPHHEPPPRLGVSPTEPRPRVGHSTLEPRKAQHRPPPKPQPPRDKGIMINGRQYETAVETTPPGHLVPIPIITLPPMVRAPSPSPDDPYRFDESDESDEDVRPPQPVDNAPPDDGFIPAFWGVQQPAGAPHLERDNSFRYMFSNHAYYSSRSNSLFTGRSATDASDYEHRHSGPYCPPNASQLYARAPRGVPLNVLEVRKLLTLVKDRTKRFSIRDMEEAFLLLRELFDVARRVTPSTRDRAMEFISQPGVFNPEFTHYFGRGVREPLLPNICRDSLFDPSIRPSIQAPPLGQSLEIDVYGLYVLLHGQPGSVTPVSGILMDHALRVHRRSVFGYGLGRLLTPTDRVVQPTFHRLFACLVVLPGRYREAIGEYNQRNPSPFVAQLGPSFHLQRPRIDANRAPNLGLEDIINVLLDNRVPPSWVDHAYPYGLAYIDSHYAGCGLHQAVFDEIDNERLARVRTHDIPPAIPEWDGWRYPSAQEVSRLHLIQSTAEDRSLSPRNRNNIPEHHQGREAPAWLLVGQPTTTMYLTHRPAAIAQPYAKSHPVTLPPTTPLEPFSSSTTVGEDTLMTELTPGNTHPANTGINTIMDYHGENPPT